METSTRRWNTRRFPRNNSETGVSSCLRRPARRRRLGGKPLRGRTFHGTTLETDVPRGNAEFGGHQTHRDSVGIGVIVDSRGLLVHNPLQHGIQHIAVHIIPVEGHSPR